MITEQHEGSGARVRVLFLCMDNSSRSQMAEGLLRRLQGDRYYVRSAGPFPASVAPEAVEVMREIGVDISAQRSKSSYEYFGQEFERVFQICDQLAEPCPVFPGGGTRTCWPIRDPATGGGIRAERLAAYRTARDHIRDLVRETFGLDPSAGSSPTPPARS